MQESLLYWPAPIIISEEDIDELGIREAVNMYFSDEELRSKSAIMRSPFRFDFDSLNANELHPATHVHLQHADCRISAKRPICFNTFIKFVFKNFYPDSCPSILDDLKRLNYSGFDICDNAVICL